MRRYTVVDGHTVYTLDCAAGEEHATVTSTRVKFVAPMLFDVFTVFTLHLSRMLAMKAGRRINSMDTYSHYGKTC